MYLTIRYICTLHFYCQKDFGPSWVVGPNVLGCCVFWVYMYIQLGLGLGLGLALGVGLGLVQGVHLGLGFFLAMEFLDTKQSPPHVQCTPSARIPCTNSVTYSPIPPPLPPPCHVQYTPSLPLALEEQLNFLSVISCSEY